MDQQADWLARGFEQALLLFVEPLLVSAFYTPWTRHARRDLEHLDTKHRLDGAISVVYGDIGRECHRQQLMNYVGKSVQGHGEFTNA